MLAWLLLAQRRARTRSAWLRSDVPSKLAYARLRLAIDRERDSDGPAT